MTRREAIKAMTIGGCLIGINWGCTPDNQSAKLKSTVDEEYASLQALKKDVKFASKWWHFNLQGRTFVVCLQEFPSAGETSANIHIWKQTKVGAFGLVWSFRTLGIGPFDVLIDQDKGSVSLKGIANNEFKNAIFATVMLAATIG